MTIKKSDIKAAWREIPKEKDACGLFDYLVIFDGNDGEIFISMISIGWERTYYDSAVKEIARYHFRPAYKDFEKSVKEATEII